LSLSRLTVLFTLGCALLPAHSRAQPRPTDATRELQLLESTERGLDPLGLDDSTGKLLDEAARRLQAVRKTAAIVPLPTAELGSVLTAIPGVSEVACAQEVSLGQGLAFVKVRLRFESRVAHRAQLAYRLAVPRQAAVSKVSACKRGVCVQAGVGNERAARQAAGPQLAAERIHDATGDALAVRVASVEKGAPLELTVEYVAEAPVHGGVVRFRLPARGYDPRIVDGQVLVSATSGFVITSPESSVLQEPARALDVVAELRPKLQRATVSTRARCGGALCTRSFEAAPLLPPRTRETWLLLDASPSMEGNGRNRADVLLAALLASMPPDSPLRVLAFAQTTLEVGRYVAQVAPLKPISDALTSQLGSASRPESALSGPDLARLRPLVLLVSDARLDAAALRGLAAARAKGAELWLLNVGDRPAAAVDFDGVIDVAEAGVDGFHGVSSEQLEERLRVPFSRRVHGTLRHGEQRVVQKARARLVPRSGDPWLSFWLSRDHPVAFASTQSSESFIAAPPFQSAPPRPLVADTGMPKESVLSMLRTQLVPQARACLRNDRKGRADYAVQATFHALFADREAYDVRVEGKLQEVLRACLMQVVARLRVPAFSGRIRVRYPIHTEREEESPMIELEREASREIDRIIHSP